MTRHRLWPPAWLAIPALAATVGTGLFLVPPDDRHEARKNLAVLRIAAAVGNLGLHRRVEFLGVLLVQLRRKNHFCKS